MELREITRQEFKQSMPALLIIADQIGACEAFLCELKECETPSRMVSLLKAHSREFADKLGFPGAEEITSEDVQKYFENNPYTVKKVTDMIADYYSQDEANEIALKSMNAGGLINEMKLGLFMQIIHEVSLSEVEQLYAAHRPGSYEASTQMKLAV